jgi:hypothetical protein
MEQWFSLVTIKIHGQKMLPVCWLRMEQASKFVLLWSFLQKIRKWKKMKIESKRFSVGIEWLLGLPRAEK